MEEKKIYLEKIGENDYKCLFSNEDVNEIVKGLNLTMSRVAYGNVPEETNRIYKYKGKYGEGYAVQHDTFYSRNKNCFFCEEDIYTKGS